MRSNTIVAWSSVSASLASNRAIVQGREPAPVVVASAFRSFCLLYAAFKLNALLWNGGQHGYRILVPNLGRYHCIWHLDCRWHDRRWLAFGLDAHGTTYRHCGFDQPLSSNSRCQNRVAVRRPEPSQHGRDAADWVRGDWFCVSFRGPQRLEKGQG